MTTVDIEVLEAPSASVDVINPATSIIINITPPPSMVVDVIDAGGIEIIEVSQPAQAIVDVIECSTTATVEITAPATADVVELIHPGPQGPTGPQGPIGPVGPASAFYVHTQSTPSSTWTINHNLGFKPAVELLDSGSQEIDGEVSHPNVNQTVVTLNPASAGVARLN